MSYTDDFAISTKQSDAATWNNTVAALKEIGLKTEVTLQKMENGLCTSDAPTQGELGRPWNRGDGEEPDDGGRQ